MFNIIFKCKTILLFIMCNVKYNLRKPFKVNKNKLYDLVNFFKS